MRKTFMANQSPLTQLKSILRSKRPAAAKAQLIIQLTPELRKAEVDDIVNAIEVAEPLVEVALMYAYFEITKDDSYESALETILKESANNHEGEELYMLTRLALGRLHGQEPKETLAETLNTGLKITAVRERAVRGVGRAAAPQLRERITIMIHGTWASGETWWRPGGDFFQFVKDELERPDLYGAKDLFQWSGKNWESSRRTAANDLNSWLRSHPSAVVNIFAHSHGANVAMLATHQGITVNRLVMLSPPVRRDYFAKWSNVKNAYNIQAKFDPVVAIASGSQWFNLPNVKEKQMQASGHSSSHDPGVWRAERLAKFIEMPWT